jgi:hypothetical protein
MLHATCKRMRGGALHFNPLQQLNAQMKAGHAYTAVANIETLSR